MMEEDERGNWKIIQGQNCLIRQLVEPSQAFLDWQASNPTVEPEPPRDLAAEIDDLKVRIGELENE